jgi:uncharacterized membrane protein
MAEEPSPLAQTPLPGRAYPPPARREPVWPSRVTICAVIGLQLVLPEGVTAGPRWLLPVLEAVLLGGLWLGTPTELRLQHKGRRRLALALTILVSAANIANLALLSHELLHRSIANGRGLIVGGVFIWLTNFMIFGLWYWETDRGGPAIRAAGEDGRPDFLFVQMNDDRIQPADWRPQYIDYLYLSLTNATAFSPTDTMPLTPIAKSMMGVQSIVSLVTIGLIVSRAVNILPG